jgi:acyl carrier protein
MDIENSVRRILEKNTQMDFTTVANDISLIDSRFNFNSIVFIQCVVDLEVEFDIELYDEELLQSSFETIDNIIKIVSGHLKEKEIRNE